MTTIPVTVTVQDKNNQLATSVGGSVTPGGATGSFNSGETAIGTLDDNGNANIILAQPVTLTQAGTIASLSIYITTLSGQVRLVIYSDVSGKPGSKLAETAAFTPIAAWNTKPTLTTPVFQAGNYWLAFLPQNNSLGFRKFRTTGTSWFNSFTFATAPATFPNTGATSTISHWSMYATFSGGTVATVWVNSVTSGGTVPPNPPNTGNCPFGTALPDGCPGAPAGTAIQYPNDRATYAHAPQWNVAGWDYPVGIPAATVLKDPYSNFGTSTLVAALTAIGGSASGASVRFTGSSATNAVVDGYDFSLHGGCVVQVDNCTNFTFQNCYWQVGTNANTPIFLAGSSVGATPANGVTIQYCQIDGNGTSNGIGFGLIQANSHGQLKIQYCWLRRAFSENIVYGNNSVGAASLQIQFNVIDTAGMGFASGAHGDWIQIVNQNGSGGAGGTLDDVEFLYNLWRQPSPFGGGATQGLSISSANATQAPTTGGHVTGNVLQGLGTNSVTWYIIVNTPNITNQVNVDSNYFDLTGDQFGVIFYGNFNGGSSTGGPGSGNTNMITGATIPVG